MLIMSLFALIGFWSQLNLLLLCIMGEVFLITFVICSKDFYYSAKLQQMSSEFSASYLRNDLQLNSILRRQFKSCRPIAICMGNFDKVGMQTFPNIMSEVVVANVVDLLLLVQS